MVNTEIRQFRDTIVAMLNTSPLPIEIKRLVFAEIINNIDMEANQMIEIEKQQAEKENNKAQEDKNE